MSYCHQMTKEGKRNKVLRNIICFFLNFFLHLFICPYFSSPPIRPISPRPGVGVSGGAALPTLLTRAGRRQFPPGRTQAPCVEINTQAGSKHEGRQCELKEMVVHVAELHAPEESGSHGCRRQDESIEPLKKARTPPSAQRACEMAPSIEERNVIFKVLISLFRPNMHKREQAIYTDACLSGNFSNTLTR